MRVSCWGRKELSSDMLYSGPHINHLVKTKKKITGLISQSSNWVFPHVHFCVSRLSYISAHRGVPQGHMHAPLTSHRGTSCDIFLSCRRRVLRLRSPPQNMRWQEPRAFLAVPFSERPRMGFLPPRTEFRSFEVRAVGREADAPRCLRLRPDARHTWIQVYKGTRHFINILRCAPKHVDQHLDTVQVLRKCERKSLSRFRKFACPRAIPGLFLFTCLSVDVCMRCLTLKCNKQISFCHRGFDEKFKVVGWVKGDSFNAFTFHYQTPASHVFGSK